MGDSKYGFSLSSQRSNQSGSPEYLGNSLELRSPHYSSLDLPPVDRNAKLINHTPRGTIRRSIQERLRVNKTDSILNMGNYTNATPHKTNATSSLERAQPKAGSYDNMSLYDSYNNNTNGNANYGMANLNTSTGRLGPNVSDDLKNSNIPARAHDPHRFTRSTAQSISTHDSQTRTDYAKYSRSADYKSIPISQIKQQARINRFHLRSRRITGHHKRLLNKWRTTGMMGTIRINSRRVIPLLRRMCIIG